jgi:hypothetical protein
MNEIMTPTPKTTTYNALCTKCLRHCKQPADHLLLECPRYYPLPFKVEKLKFDQLDLFDREE